MCRVVCDTTMFQGFYEHITKEMTASALPALFGQHDYVWEEVWAVIYRGAGRVDGISRDVVHRKGSRTARVRLGKENGRYLSRCRRWVSLVYTARLHLGSKSGRSFRPLTAMSTLKKLLLARTARLRLRRRADDRFRRLSALHVYVGRESGRYFSRCR